MQQTLNRPTEIKLSNGIPVIIQHYDSPVAATYWWNQVGSVDELPHEAGFAHFLEHMLFKDAAAKETGKASTGQTARAVETLGGEINAYTSFDQTVYHVTCAAQHWEKVLAQFAPMALPQKFLKKDFDHEREVILEELRKNEDSPGRKLFQGLLSTVFSSHPYGRPVIGTRKSLGIATVRQLEQFYKRQYIPSKMGIVLVGPFDDSKPVAAARKVGNVSRRQKIISILEKHYGKIPSPRNGKASTHWRLARGRKSPSNSQDQPKMLVVPFDIKAPMLSFSFRSPELFHADIPALDLLTGILGMGEMSRFYQKLFYQSSLVTDISGGLFVPKDPGIVYFQAETENLGQVNSTFEKSFEELERLKSEGPTSEELQRVIVNSESEKLYATQTADGLANRMGALRFGLGDLEFDQKYLEKLKAVDTFEIQEVARKYFKSNQLNASMLIPKDSPGYDDSYWKECSIRILGNNKDLQKQIKNARPLSSHKTSAGVHLPLELNTLPSGLKVAHLTRKASPVFSIYVVFHGGLRLENPYSWGSANLLSHVWTKGTFAKSSQEISKIVEGHAANIDGFSGRNSTGLQIVGLAKDWEILSNLFIEILSAPSFPQNEIDHSKRVVEDLIRGIDDHTSQICMKLFLQELYDHHPYGKLTLGSMESVKAIQRTDLLALHQSWVKSDRLIVAISGATDSSQAQKFIEKLEKSLENKINQEKKSPPITNTQKSPANPEPLKAPRWIDKNLNREQCHIVVGGLGTKTDSPDRYSLKILQTLLGGQSGRLFIELREKKSLAYTVAPIGFEGIERGYVGTYIACSRDKKQEALSGIAKVLSSVKSKNITRPELARAKEYLLGRRAMDLQSDSALASHFALELLYGNSDPKRDELHEKIQNLQAKDIEEACQNYLLIPPMVTSVVG